MTAEKMGDDSFCSTAHGNLSQLSLTEGRPQMARPHVERWVVLMKELGVEEGPKGRPTSCWLKATFGARWRSPKTVSSSPDGLIPRFR